ncbi:Uncharacterised protein [Mycobacteroides abscessus subsp. abscessus]|nr:Uncharacterised protein [Mycobacteroides abscessus subsp. abscessus]
MVNTYYHQLKKVGQNMSGNRDNGYYELVYNNRQYNYLEFIRLDTICEISYITLKNIITGEFFTFEENQVRKVTKRNFRIRSFRKQFLEKVAK